MLKVQEIREIIKLIDDSNINEFTYETDGTKIKIKKPTTHTSNESNNGDVQPVTIQEIEPVVKVQKEVQEVEKSIVSTEQPTENYDYEIKSPMVGTFYEAPSPESEPYIKVGQKVDEQSIVCIVEAMKLFNEIEAEISGEIIEVLVKDGELVEYGQPLFRVKTT